MDSSSSVDYTLYLVTDSTSEILGQRDLVEVVESALKGGVTVVQYRDKVSDTAVLVATGKRLHSLTRKYHVPLLINDRIDIALAVGCEGLHIGQDDLDLLTARRLLGKTAIIGVSVSTPEEALKAWRNGADYLGIGTMFATPTKSNTKDIIGTAGTKQILSALAGNGSKISTVCIGGINKSTIQRVIYQSSAPGKKLNGVAVVSSIIAAEQPQQAAAELLNLAKTPPPFVTHSLANQERKNDPKELIAQVSAVIKAVGEKAPLSHNMTNLVVQNFAANIALAVGGSPIMTDYGEEAADLCTLGSALVINMGTVTPIGLMNYSQALRCYNLEGAPVVFDPVGAGATAVRRAAVKTLLAEGYFDVIKGNEGEIRTVFGSLIQQKGVDSGVSTLNHLEKAALVRDLAARERNVVLMTGATDYLSDGDRTYTISNGHELLGKITGSGCVLGTTISLMLTASRGDKLLATLAGVLHFEIAAEIAAARADVKGPGTFVPALLDELYNIQKATAAGSPAWLGRAKVNAIEF